MARTYSRRGVHRTRWETLPIRPDKVTFGFHPELERNAIYATKQLLKKVARRYANPWRPDWAAHQRSLDGAHRAMREVGAA